MAYSNLQSYEGNVTGIVTETLSDFQASRRIQVTNDSGSSALKFYPKGTAVDNYLTLYPSETITLDNFRTSQFSVQGSDVTYRVWVWG